MTTGRINQVATFFAPNIHSFLVVKTQAFGLAPPQKETGAEVDELRPLMKRSEAVASSFKPLISSS
jgi:hypothetical protein